MGPRRIVSLVAVTIALLVMPLPQILAPVVAGAASRLTGGSQVNVKDRVPLPWFVQSQIAGSMQHASHASVPTAATAQTQTVTDGPGNVYYAKPPATLVNSPASDPADLISATASDDGTNVTLSAMTVALNDPTTDPNWRNASYIAWAIDPNFSGSAKYFAYFEVNRDGSYNGHLTYAATDTEVSCTVTLDFNTTVGYQAVIPTACLPGVTSFQWLAYSLYDTVPLAQDPHGMQGFGKALPDVHTSGGVEFAPPVAAPAPSGPSSAANGIASSYWLFASDGGVFTFGSGGFFGSEGGSHLNRPVVGGAATLDGLGYWEVASDGGIFTFGDARYYGSTGNINLNAPIVEMIPLPTGTGYWLVASDGGIFTFGGAQFYGSEGGSHLNQPVVGGASTPDGLGYWLVARDGGVFAFGDARFDGSTGGMHLNMPVVGMATDPYGGYWLVSSDGGVFTFGGAAFLGSTGGTRLTEPVEGIAPTADANGYRLVASDGGVFAFGHAPFLGSEGGDHLNEPVVGLSSLG